MLTPARLAIDPPSPKRVNDWSSKLISFDYQPLASASIRQMHSSYLYSLTLIYWTKLLYSFSSFQIKQQVGEFALSYRYGSVMNNHDRHNLPHEWDCQS